MASGDGSDWGSSSGCENQGSCASKGEAVDAGDDDNDGSGLRLARAEVAQAGAAETGANGCRSLAMARTGSVIAQTGLSS